MPSSCCVPLCNNIGTGHNFPKDPQLRKQWIAAVKRVERWLPGPHTKVCHKHFTPDDYRIGECVLNLRRILKPDAVPSVFNWKPLPKARPTKRNKIAAKVEARDSKHISSLEAFKEHVTTFRIYPANGSTAVQSSLLDATTDVNFTLRFMKGHKGFNIRCSRVSSTESWQNKSELIPTHTIHIEQ